MPIHRIELPHSTSSLGQGEPISDIQNEQQNHSNTSSSKSLNVISNNKNYASNGSISLQPKSNTNNFLTKSRIQSSTSLLSMLSNQSATTEYSPNLIDNECGNLLNIPKLSIDDNNTNNNNLTAIHSLPHSPKLQSFNNIQRHFPKVSFDLSGTNSDAESEIINDHDQTIHNFDDIVIDEASLHDHHNYHDYHGTTPLSRQITSTDICGSCHDPESILNNGVIDYNDESKWDYKEKWIFVLIGLPACGKSTIISDFEHYVKSHVSDNKIRIKSYNAGEVRRKYEAQERQRFNFNDLKASENLRNQYALEALQNLANDLINDVNDIGILDATNTTKDRRESIFNFIKEASNKSKVVIHPLLLEVKCSNRALRRYNIEQKSKNKDYVKMNREVAINDFLERIRNYELSYEKVTLQEINRLNVKYFGIDNVGDSIYYDCGLDHHDNRRHQNLLFKNIALNLLYQFLIHYRTDYCSEYLTNVDEFYTGGHYHPIKTSFSNPVSPEEVKKVRRASIAETFGESPLIKQDSTTSSNYKLPKVLSSSRIRS